MAFLNLLAQMQGALNENLKYVIRPVVSPVTFPNDEVYVTDEVTCHTTSVLLPILTCNFWFFAIYKTSGANETILE